MMTMPKILAFIIAFILYASLAHIYVDKFFDKYPEWLAFVLTLVFIVVYWWIATRIFGL